MIQKLRNKFVSFFNSHTERMIASCLFDHRKVEMQKYALHSKESGISDNAYFDNQQVIVSLTTFDKRLFEVYLTIESIMQQTLKPNRIVLWLAEDLINKEIPQILKRQEKRGLEIRYCNDIKSYKKLIPSLREFPNDYIITIDDDVIYEFDMIENLLTSYKVAPGFVYANRVRRMSIKNGKIDCYNTWKILEKGMDDSPLNIPTGVGGVLYPPHCFTEEVFNENVFMDICGQADDIWFKAMCLLKGTQSRLALIHNPVYYENESVQDVALYNTNVGYAHNDKQLNLVFKKYNIYSLLSKI